VVSGSVIKDGAQQAEEDGRVSPDEPQGKELGGFGGDSVNGVDKRLSGELGGKRSQ